MLYDRVVFLEKALGEQNKIFQKLQQDNKTLEKAIAQQQNLVDNAAEVVRAADDSRAQISNELVALKNSLKDTKAKLDESERVNRVTHSKYITAVETSRKLDTLLKEATAGRVPDQKQTSDEEVQKLQQKVDSLDREKRTLEKKVLSLSQELKKKEQAKAAPPVVGDSLEEKIKALEHQVSILSRAKDVSDRKAITLTEQLKKLTSVASSAGVASVSSLQEEVAKLQNQVTLLDRSKIQSEGKLLIALKEIQKLTAVIEEKEKEIKLAALHLKSRSRAIGPLPRVSSAGPNGALLSPTADGTLMTEMVKPDSPTAVETPKLSPTDIPKFSSTDTPKFSPTETPKLSPTETPTPTPLQLPLASPLASPKVVPSTNNDDGVKLDITPSVETPKLNTTPKTPKATPTAVPATPATIPPSVVVSPKVIPSLDSPKGVVASESAKPPMLSPIVLSQKVIAASDDMKPSRVEIDEPKSVTVISGPTVAESSPPPKSSRGIEVAKSASEATAPLVVKKEEAVIPKDVVGAPPSTQQSSGYRKLMSELGLPPSPRSTPRSMTQKRESVSSYGESTDLEEGDDQSSSAVSSARGSGGSNGESESGDSASTRPRVKQTTLPVKAFGRSSTPVKPRRY